jgi:hypothetical protein
VRASRLGKLGDFQDPKTCGGTLKKCMDKALKSNEKPGFVAFEVKKSSIIRLPHGRHKCDGIEDNYPTLYSTLGNQSTPCDKLKIVSVYSTLLKLNACQSDCCLIDIRISRLLEEGYIFYRIFRRP